MRRREFIGLVAAVLIMSGLADHHGVAFAQDAGQPVYVVSYVEVAPHSSSRARQLMLGYRADARKASGALQIAALQRIDIANHFALIEQWQTQNARQDFAASDAAIKFRAALAPLQSAAYDERLHAALAVGPARPESADPVVIVTHVDVVPTAVEAGSAQVTSFVAQGRAAKGNRRFDALVQSSRRNHMTIVESWGSQADKNAWISTPAARSFREALQPMSGSLYDERAYRELR